MVVGFFFCWAAVLAHSLLDLGSEQIFVEAFERRDGIGLSHGMWICAYYRDRVNCIFNAARSARSRFFGLSILGEEGEKECECPFYS
jgi:hypothetical protein